jgi:L-ascorbate metabolism protein UlaG (beta-lactamase superfamily)
MNRRLFLAKLLAAFKVAAFSSLLPPMISTKTVEATDGGKMRHKSTGGLSLREIARKKIHHGNGQFLNLFGDGNQGRLLRVLHWKLFDENRFKSFYTEEKVHPVTVDWAPIRRDRGLSITFIKHACILIKDMDQYIIVDPVFFSPFWFIKDFSPLAFDFHEMPKPQHVLITHGHYDHLDKRSLASLDKKTHVITPLGYDDIFKDLEMSERTQLDWFDSYTQGPQEVTLLPCNHWTMRNPITGPNRSLWGSFLVKTASGFTIFIAGDAAHFAGFHELGGEFHIDLAIFNLGAYEPRWFMASSHINPRETVQAFKDLGAKHLLIVHWGTFRLGDEPVHFPPIQIRKEMETAGFLNRLIHLNHGETLFYDRYRNTT